MPDALRHARLVAERDAILAVIPPDPSADIRAAELQRSRLEKERDDLAKGNGRNASHPVAQALRELRGTESDVARLERNLSGSGRSRKDKRSCRAELEKSRLKLATAARDVANLTAPELARLDKEAERLEERLYGLWQQRETYQSWVSRHPEAEGRLHQLADEIASLEGVLHPASPGRDLPPSLQPARWAQLARGHGRDLGLDLGR